MLRLSKRCRLLVSVLLVCGFCLSYFSVNAFAADLTAPLVFSDARKFKSFTTSDPNVYGNTTISFTGGNVEYVSESNVTHTYLLKMNGYIVLNILNANTYPVMVDASRFEFSGIDLKIFDSSSVSQVGVQYITDCEVLYGDVYPASFNNSSFSIRFDEYYMGGENASYLILPANTTMRAVISIDTEGYGTISSNFSYPSFIINGVDYLFTMANAYSSVSVPTVTRYEGTIPTKDNTNLDILEGVHEQTQQQQQQYEDFTDPDTQGGSDLITGTEDEIEGKIGIFTFIDNLIQRFLGLFTSPEASTALTLPAFTMEIQGETHQIWDEYTFDLSSLDGPFNVLITAVRFATVATVYFAFLSYLQKTYNRIIGGHDG